MNIKMFYPNVKTVLGVTALTLMSISCSKNDLPSGKGNLSVSAKSSTTAAGGKSLLAKTDQDLVITKFLVNVKEFELEMDTDNPVNTAGNDDEWDDDGVLGFDDEIELTGPFEINLLSGQVTFLDVTLPVGKFEELEFKFSPSTNDQSVLFQKSILIKGKFKGVPFVFWHNFEEEVEIDFEDPQIDIEVSELDEKIVIDFDINQVFNITNGVDLSQAQDGNNDGVVEISPSDADGNNAIANEIKEAIKKAIDLLDN